MIVSSAMLIASFASAVPCGSDDGCVVDVEVGSATLRLRVDTGADITTITDGAASRAGLRVRRQDPLLILSGASQDFLGVLKRTTMEVDGHPEKDVMIVVAPHLQVADVDGLLGMSYLERFRVTVGEDLELTPVDANDSNRHDGRGEQWWRLVFKTVRTRRVQYERALADAKKADAAIESIYGRSFDGENLTTYTQRLHDFMRDYEKRLQNYASRFSVPRAWRSKR